MHHEATFRNQLVDAKILIQSGVDGIYGRSGLFESIVDGIDNMISCVGRDQAAEIVRFPPGMPRNVMETSGYLNGFPHLAGTVHCFCGDERAHAALLRNLTGNEDWTAGQRCVDQTLTPAACYPVYPMVSSRCALSSSCQIVDVASYCFRH